MDINPDLLTRVSKKLKLFFFLNDKKGDEGVVMKGLFFIVFLLVTSLQAQARKPAVEDFVGVEPETYKSTPPGTEVIFNFNQNVQQYNQNSPQSTTAQSPWFGVGVILMFVALPLLVWSGLRNSPSPKIVMTKDVSPASDPNVHNLEDYRKPEEDSKKAS